MTLDQPWSIGEGRWNDSSEDACSITSIYGLHVYGVCARVVTLQIEILKVDYVGRAILGALKIVAIDIRYTF